MSTLAEPDPVILRTFSSESEALIAKSALAAFGIESTLSSDDFGGEQLALALTNGIRLLVSRADASQAEEVLSNVAENPS